VQLVATPHRRRHRRGEPEQPARIQRIVGETARAVDRLGDVGNEAVTPEAQLVAEDPQIADPLAADRALPDDAAVGAVGGADRRRLDHPSAFRYPHLERSVVEIEDGSVRTRRDEPLVDAAIQPNEMPTGAERQPVQVDASCLG
jgi:hypothetical protein